MRVGDNQGHASGWVYANRVTMPVARGPSLVTAAVNGAALVLTYDAALDPNEVPNGGLRGAYRLLVNGNPRRLASTNPVAIRGRRVTLTLSSPVTAGQVVTISYLPYTASNPGRPVQAATAAGSNDVGEADVGALIRRAVVNVTGDTAAPALRTATVNGNTVTLTYSETLDPASVPAAGAFAVTVASSPRAVTGVAVSGRRVTLTLTAAVSGGETVTVTYNPPTTNRIRDLAGNNAANLSGQSTINVTGDGTAPSVSTATPPAVNGATLTLTWDEALDPVSVPATSAFEVMVEGYPCPRAVTGVAVSGQAVTLTLRPAVVGGRTVTVTYNPPTTNRIQDYAGNPAPRLDDQAVENQAPAPPAVTRVEVSSNPGGDNTYAAGDVIWVNVYFDLPLSVDTTGGMPYLPLRIGAATVRAYYDVDNSFPGGFLGTAIYVLRFEYTVASGDFVADGISLDDQGFDGVYAIELNGGTIRNRVTGGVGSSVAGTVDANLRIGSTPEFAGGVAHNVDTGVDVRSVAITSTPADGETYRIGEQIVVRVHINRKTVAGARGAPRMALTLDSGTRYAAFGGLDHAVAGGSVLIFRYPVVPGDSRPRRDRDRRQRHRPERRRVHRQSGPDRDRTSWTSPSG